MKPTGSHQSDEELILRYYSAGDDFAFKVLERRHFSRLYGVFLRYGVPANDIPDCIQDAWFRVIHTSGSVTNKFDPEKAGFTTWLYRIAAHLALDYARRPRNRREVRESELGSDDEGAEESYLEKVAAQDPDPEEEFESQEMSAKLLLCLSKLPESHLLIVHFRDDDLTFAQIGEILELPLQTVATRHRRALERLRVCLTTGLPTNPQQTL